VALSDSAGSQLAIIVGASRHRKAHYGKNKLEEAAMFHHIKGTKKSQLCKVKWTSTMLWIDFRT